MNHQRFQVIFLTQPLHLVALRQSEGVLGPLTRAGRKHLKSIAAETVCPLRSILRTTRARSVNADAPRSQAGRAFGRPCENILFTGDGTVQTGHQESISRRAM